jgi:hypothetical protein
VVPSGVPGATGRQGWCRRRQAPCARRRGGWAGRDGAAGGRAPALTALPDTKNETEEGWRGRVGKESSAVERRGTQAGRRGTSAAGRRQAGGGDDLSVYATVPGRPLIIITTFASQELGRGRGRHGGALVMMVLRRVIGAGVGGRVCPCPGGGVGGIAGGGLGGAPRATRRRRTKICTHVVRWRAVLWRARRQATGRCQPDINEVWKGQER